MAKSSESVKTNFIRATEITLSDYKELQVAIFRKTREKALASTLAEQFARSLALEWESFLDELITTYVYEQPTHYLRVLRGNIEKSLADRYGREALTRLTFRKTRPSTKQEVAGLIDPKNFNVTAKTSTELSSKANSLLPAKLALLFALDQGDAEFFDLSVCLRNYLSHKSRGSLDALRNSLDSLSQMENDGFKSTIGSRFSLHSYLKESTWADVDRVELFGFRLIEISEHL